MENSNFGLNIIGNNWNGRGRPFFLTGTIQIFLLNEFFPDLKDYFLEQTTPFSTGYRNMLLKYEDTNSAQLRTLDNFALLRF